MAMEYFGRLGLVFRKNILKERGRRSPCQAAESKDQTRCAAESSEDRSSNEEAFDTDLKSPINESISLRAPPETGHTQELVEFRGTTSPRLQGAAVLETKSMPIAAQYYPSQDALVDIEYLEYEQHVQARAQALRNDRFGGYGGRFGWKTLMFWKRQPRPTGMKSFVSAASTPRHHQPFRTPLHRKAATPGRSLPYGHARRGCATVGPLYRNESPTASMQQFSHRARRDDCNMSPYVPLSHQRQRIVSPGPLYLV